MKFYDYLRMMDALMNYENLERLSNFAKAKLPFQVVVSTSTEDRCYTRYTWSGTRIVLGLNFIKEAFDFPDKIPGDKLSEYWELAATLMLALYYHELFHGMYTPMKYVNNIFRRMDDKLASFLHPVMNILEDATIEPSGCDEIPKAKEPLEVLNTCHVTPEKLEAIEEQFKNNPENLSTVISWLLLKARDLAPELVEKYSVYQDNKAFFDNSIFAIERTIDGKERVRKELLFGKRILKILKHEDPNEVDENTPDFEGPSVPSSRSGGNSGNTKLLDQIVDTIKKIGSNPSNWNEHEPDETSQKEIKTPEEIKQVEMKAQHNPTDNEDDSDYEAPSVHQPSDVEIKSLANDEPVLNATHRAEHLSKHKNTSCYINQYNQALSEVNSVVSSTTRIIRKMKSKNQTAFEFEQTSGKFDLKSVLNPKRLNSGKVFKKEVAPSTLADLVVMQELDLSGSMLYNQGTVGKAKLAGLASIALSESLNRLGYPFAVYSFTEGSDCITVKLKDFKDSYEKVKTNLTLFTEGYNVSELHTWSGNVDEVNIKYARDILRKQKQKDKIFITISDGATCGSASDLRKLVQSMEKEGITVLGIGIYDDNVKDIYTNHIIIKTEEDLKKLPEFLTKYLISKIFVKEDDE